MWLTCLTVNQSLSAKDLATIRLFTFKLDMGLTERAFSALPTVFPDQCIPSWKVTCSHVQFLLGFQPVRYDCCPNSCICYTAQYENLENCPQCRTARFQDGKPQKYFEYLPFIPCLCSMVVNWQITLAMCY